MAYNFKLWWVGAYRFMGSYWNEYSTLNTHRVTPVYVTCAKWQLYMGSNFKVGQIFVKTIPMSSSGCKESEKSTLCLSLMYSSLVMVLMVKDLLSIFSIWGQTKWKFQICKILIFSFEILQFVSSKVKYRYVFEFNVLLCHASHTVVSRKSHFLQATTHNTED